MKTKNDLLDHLGGFLLDGFELFVEVLPRSVGPSADSIYGSESLELVREPQWAKWNVRKVVKSVWVRRKKGERNLWRSLWDNN